MSLITVTIKPSDKGKVQATFASKESGEAISPLLDIEQIIEGVVGGWTTREDRIEVELTGDQLSAVLHQLSQGHKVGDFLGGAGEVGEMLSSRTTPPHHFDRPANSIIAEARSLISKAKEL